MPLIKYLLASDEDKVCEKLGIWIEKSMYGKKYFGISRSTFVFDSDGKIYIVKWDGSDYWPDQAYSVGEKIQKGVALHDFNGDEKDDIVYGTDGNTLEIQYSDGEVDIYEVGGKIRSAPIIIEFNNNEYLVVAASKDDNLYAFNPILGIQQFIYETGGDVESPSAFEHSEYGVVIVFGSSDGNLYMIDTNGNDIPGWPKVLGAPVKGSPSISDIDGDGLPDIAIGQAEGKFFVFNENANLLNNFPITIEFPFVSSPVIDDLDGDGDLELLIGGTSALYGYDFKAENGSSNEYWSMYRGNYQRTGYFESESYLGTDINEIIPASFKINSVYPNPFNPIATINIDIPSNEKFNLSIFNVKGSLVEQIYEGQKVAGNYTFNWDASNYSSGMYLVKLSYNNNYNSYKIMLVK